MSLNKKAMIKTLGGTIALSLVLTACGAGNTTSGSGGGASGQGAKPADTAASAPAAKKNVSFTIGYAAGDPATKQALADAVANYMKANPNIKITDLSENTSSSYLDWLKTKDAVGEFPDLVEMRDPQIFGDAGKIAELPPELIGLLETAPKVNGKVYTAPFVGTFPQGIIYSKKAYADAGITSDPKTYDEFLADQEKLKAKGITPIVMGGKDIFHWGFWINKFLVDDVYVQNPDWNSQRTAGKVSFTDPGPMKAMQDFSELFAKGYIDKGFNSTADNQTASVLVSGKAAELFSGPWMFPQIAQADPKFEFGWYALPDHQGNVNVVGLPTAGGWSLSTKAAQDADKKAAITDFIKWFFTKDQYTKFLKAINGLPTTKEKITYDASPQMQRVLDVMADPKTKKSLAINNWWGENQIPAPFRNWFYKQMQDAVTKGDFSVDTMKKADAEYDTEVKAAKK